MTDTKIQSTEQIIRTKMHEEIDKVRHCFAKSVRPIYSRDLKDNLKFAGSCCLIELSGEYLLVTAAHIVDEIFDTPSYITTKGGKFEQIFGSFESSIARDQNRAFDQYDFAWQILNDHMVNLIGTENFLTSENYWETYTLQPHGRCFTLLGYPRSKNKKVIYKPQDSRESLIRPKIFAYGCLAKEHLYEELNLVEEHHLVLNYNHLHSSSDDGALANSYSPVGMSGGLVFDIGKFKDPDIYSSRDKIKPSSVALLIEFYKEKNAVVATKLSFILKIIQENSKKTRALNAP